MFQKSNVRILVWLLVVGWVFPASVVVAGHRTAPDITAPQPPLHDSSSSLRGNQRQLTEQENPYDFTHLAAVQNSNSSLVTDSLNSTAKYAGPETPYEIDQGKASATSSSAKTTTTASAADSPSSTRFASPQPATLVNQTQQSAVVDSVDSFLLDPNATSSSLFPPETETPSYWPLVVFGVFVTVAVALCATTAWKYNNKRSSYTSIPN